MTHDLDIFESGKNLGLNGLTKMNDLILLFAFLF